MIQRDSIRKEDVRARYEQALSIALLPYCRQSTTTTSDDVNRGEEVFVLDVRHTNSHQLVHSSVRAILHEP